MALSWWLHPGANETPAMVRPELGRPCSCGRYWLAPHVLAVKAHGRYGAGSVGMAVHAPLACRPAPVKDLR